MKYLAYAAALTLTTACQSTIAREKWPKKICDLPSGLPKQITTGSFEVLVKKPLDARIQEAGGSGGPIYEFTIKNLNTNKTISFFDQSVGVALLEPYKAYPQLEIWSRAGSAVWCRSLCRFKKGNYRCVRIDDFKEVDGDVKDGESTTTMPNCDDLLRFVETRVPENEELLQ